MSMFDWIWRKLYASEKGAPATSDRIYEFDLPYKLETIYLHYGEQMLKKEGIFQRLPADLQKKWMTSLEKWHPLKITKADLDRIDDASWAAIANKLNLKWRNKE